MDQNLVMPLCFEGRAVRFVGTPDAPEWVAQDVCAVLEIEKTDRALAGFDVDEKGAHTVSTLGGPQLVLTVTEPGLYRLIFRSRKPQAARFRRWVFHEVLPMIRRTGSYSLSSELAAAHVLIASLRETSARQASALASALARRGVQRRIEERAAGAIERGQQLLLPDAGPLRTVEPRAARAQPLEIQRATLGRLLDALIARVGVAEPVTVREMLDDEHLRAVLADVDPALNARRLGRALARACGTPAGRHTLQGTRADKRLYFGVVTVGACS